MSDFRLAFIGLSTYDSRLSTITYSNSVLVISGIIKVEISVISRAQSRSRRPRLITLTETMIIYRISQKPNLIIIVYYNLHCFEENNVKDTAARNLN